MPATFGFWCMTMVTSRSSSSATKWKSTPTNWGWKTTCAEPTSCITLSQVCVRNTGGMPTPVEHVPRVELARGPWVVPDPGQLDLPRALQPGEDHTFDDQTLTARVPELDDVPVGDPLRVTERINLLSVQSRVNRRFANLHPRQEFTVAFPAELESVASLESQTPGRAALLVVQVKNRSRYDLGCESATKRFLGIRIELRNQDMASHVMQLDLQGQPIPWDTGYHAEIRHLAAGQTSIIRTILGVLPGAPGYTQAELFVTLELGQRHAPDQPRDRHRREYPLRIARAYDFDPTSDILLLTNHGTTVRGTGGLGARGSRAGSDDQCVGHFTERFVVVERAVDARSEPAARLAREDNHPRQRAVPHGTGHALCRSVPEPNGPDQGCREPRHPRAGVERQSTRDRPPVRRATDSDRRPAGIPVLVGAVLREIEAAG